MEFQWKKEVEQALVTSIRRYVSENRENEVGDLQATLFLQYCLEEIGPCLYNLAAVEVQKHWQETCPPLTPRGGTSSSIPVVERSPS